MRRIGLLWAAGAIVLILVVAQLVLPGIAAQRLRDRLNHSGKVISVSVSAFPAIELLWHQADTVKIHLAQYRSGTGNLGSQLSQAADVGTLDATADELTAGLLTLRDATLSKRGNTLTGSARVTESDLRASIPILQSVTPLTSGGGQLTLRGTASVLGFSGTVDATVAAQDGKLVVSPDLPFGGLATITVFSNPHVAVQGISAAPTTGGFRVSGTAQLQ
jgi:LmeA-like phospholipid-binding